MEIKRKFELHVVTNRRYIIRQTSAEQIFCTECGGPMLTAEQTAKMFGITQRWIFQMIETNSAHFTETETGAVMICIKSLTIFLDTDERN